MTESRTKENICSNQTIPLKAELDIFLSVSNRQLGAKCIHLTTFSAEIGEKAKGSILSTGHVGRLLWK